MVAKKIQWSPADLDLLFSEGDAQIVHHHSQLLPANVPIPILKAVELI